jgi:hypothetical protein
LRKLHNNELHNFYSSPRVIRKIIRRSMRGAGHVERMRKRRNSYRILVGKPKVKRPLGRQRHRLMDIIGMDLIEIGWGSTTWIDLTLITTSGLLL